MGDVKPETLADGDIFLLPTREVFQYSFENGQIGGITDLFKKIGVIAGTAAPAVVPLIPGLSQSAQQAIAAGAQLAAGFFQSSGSGQAKGLAAITQFCNEVLGLLDQLAQMVAAGQAPPDAANIAEQLVAALSDSKRVYQAKNGKDAQVLKDAKTAARQKADQIKAMLSQIQPTPGTTPTNPTNPTNPNLPSLPGGTTSGGLDSSTLALIGIGAIGIILFLK